MPWKHAGRQDYNLEDSKIFMEWAKHSGRYKEGKGTFSSNKTVDMRMLFILRPLKTKHKILNFFKK